MAPSIRQIRKAALRHFQAAELPRAPGQFPAALAGCADQLVESFGIEVDLAHDVAMSAFSELSGRASGCYIDLDLTNRHQVFVVDERAGVRRVIPLIDLVRILGPVTVQQKRA